MRCSCMIRPECRYIYYPFIEYYWYVTGHACTLHAATALFMKAQKMPKVIHWFGSNDTRLESQMAAFLIAQAEFDYFSMSREWTDGGWGWHPLYASTKCGKAQGTTHLLSTS